MDFLALAQRVMKVQQLLPQTSPLQARGARASGRVGLLRAGQRREKRVRKRASVEKYMVWGFLVSEFDRVDRVRWKKEMNDESEKGSIEAFF